MNRLETARLSLRPICVDDAPFMLELVNDPDWLRFIGDRQVRTLEDARRYISNGPMAMYDDLGFGMDLVTLKQEGEAGISKQEGETGTSKQEGRPIGVCGLVKRQGLDDVDLGFALLPAFRGHGYAFEAARATLQRGFDDLRFVRIAAIASGKNLPSVALLERLEFQFVRTVTFMDKDELLDLFVVHAKGWTLRR